eukprot:TRINITY_DN23841_c0_g3_i1.p1 TRINITY_DN23841_c0_g3~~TRINITY_DN23841_c0_g3_i1.p1  ORF type:complete len:295 (-),score=34.35 TRINITY_DN23841_c0_g3_i1:25-909(-)
MMRLGRKAMQHIIHSVRSFVFLFMVRAEAYELAFYHHIPDARTVCFQYGFAAPLLGQVGPLAFKEVGYASLQSSANTSVYIDVFEGGVGGCNFSTTSLIGGPEKAVMLASSSNTFGASAPQGTPELVANRVLDSQGQVVDISGERIALRFWNGGVGLDDCVGEMQIGDGQHQIVGKLPPGTGKQVSIACSDLGQGRTSLAFRCSGQVFEHVTDEQGLAPVFCSGSTQQVSLVGRSNGTGAYAPSVALVSGVECSCEARCTCAAAATHRAGATVALWCLTLMLCLVFAGSRPSVL